MNTLNIWIVDDDDVASFYIRRLCELDTKGATVSMFNSAGVALKELKDLRISANVPDVILLDIYMPVLSGWDFLNEFETLISGFEKQIKVYVMSSSIHPQDSRRAQANQFVQGYLSKPLTLPTISRVTTNARSA